MKYVVECRKRDEAGNISSARFAGFGNGLPDKKTALNVFRREIATGTWGAVYLEKVTANGVVIDIDGWTSTARNNNNTNNKRIKQ